MQEYEVRKGLEENISPEKLKATMQTIFGSANKQGDRLVTSFGALKELAAWPGKKSLCVETKMDPGVPDDVAQSTIKAYNTFLEQVTGYTAKERGKRAQKKAKGGKL